MKLSVYNSFIAIDKKNALLYNAKVDKFIILTQPAIKSYFKGANYICENNPELFSQLQEITAIIDDDTDEVLNLRKSIKDVVENDDLFELHINPTLDCNFNCWYCYEKHLKGSQMNTETIEATKIFIKNTLVKKNLKNFHLSFFGGEPLLYYNRVALPIINYCQDECEKKGICLSIHFTSNGYLVNKHIINDLSKRNTTFQITLDGDKNNHNKTRFLKDGQGSYDKICNNIKELASQKVYICLRINYTLQNIQSVFSIHDTFKDIPIESKKYIVIDFQRVWQDNENEDINNMLENNRLKLFRLFQNSGFKVSYHKIHNSAKVPCYADKRNNILINYDGNVYSCTARNFTKDNSEGVLQADGSIKWISNKKEKRLASKFNRKECQLCRIAPICGGGCTQNAIENAQNPGCLRGLNEQDIDKLILERFEFMFISNNEIV